MITRLARRLRVLRRAVSRSEWIARLLDLPHGDADRTSPGLLLIQVDGLSRPALDDALAAGRMPFLMRLLRTEGYRLHSIFSGLPSATPAAQAELFYGVERAVPAFAYRDRASGLVRPLYDHEAASDLEARLAKGRRGLLEGGSCWGNVLAGGAAEPHVTASTTGLREAWRTANPLSLAAAILLHLPSAVRIVVLTVVEVLFSMIDLARGVGAGHDAGAELRFVPSRVAVSILLREIAVVGASVDLARGLPIVQVNFIGYDEQAHRRGPHSAFARWTLRGIDRAIARLVAAARRSERRLYEPWIHSDHGQEPARRFRTPSGGTLRDLLEDAMRESSAREPDARGRVGGGVASRRSGWLGLARRPRSETGPAASLQLADMGPLAHAYPARPLGAEGRARVARRLVEGGVPLVLEGRTEDAQASEVTCWTRDGRHVLPRDAATVLGEDHPFLEATARELALLCRHPDAGELVISGWSPHDEALTFPSEGGAHGGPGREEVHAFALVPEDVPLHAADEGPLRLRDLRRVALEHLDRPWEAAPAVPGPPPSGEADSEAGARRLRIVTYNVHSCVGMDGVLSAERVAHVLARLRPDVACLQELDVNRARSGGIDQAHAIARHLSMDHHFHATVRVEEERYGNAVLTTLPFDLVRAESLPPGSPDSRLEPRGALWVRVDPAGPGSAVDVIVTHLGLSAHERRLQAEALLGPRWLGDPSCGPRVVVCGDFNALPGSATCRLLGARLRDAQAAADDHVPQRTFFARRPIGRIDHVFVGEGLRVIGASVPRTPSTSVASDHLPLVVDLAIEPHEPDASPNE